MSTLKRISRQLNILIVTLLIIAVYFFIVVSINNPKTNSRRSIKPELEKAEIKKSNAIVETQVALMQLKHQVEEGRQYIKDRDSILGKKIDRNANSVAEILKILNKTP